MTAPDSKLALLAQSAKSDEERRREVLRLLADSLRPENYVRDQQDCADFDGLLSTVSSELEAEMRGELARVIARSPVPFSRTARQLALDDIDIARPVLERSLALTDADLLEVVAQKTQDHMMAVTRRDRISERVSSALVERGEDRVVASLLENKQAQIDYATYEVIAHRAQDSAELQGPVIRRDCVPLDLLNELYFKVNADVRRQMLLRYDTVSEGEMAAALDASRKQWLMKHGGLPADYQASQRQVATLERRGELKAPVLVGLLRERKATAFTIAFAKLTGTEYELINRLIERQDLDALAILSRAGRFDRALFVTLAMMLTGQNGRMAGIEEFGALYETVPVEMAQRVIRFWKVQSVVREQDNGAPGP